MAGQLRPPTDASDHVRGASDAAVELVVYGDYECPYSRKTQQTVDGVFEERPGQIRYVFRHFPLMKIHPHAEDAAVAAEAAGAQGQFWAMHDLLYERQDRLEKADLVSYAAELGLDDQRFADDLQSGTHRDTVRGHIRSGVGSGVAATPTIFIDGHRWGERYRLHELLDAIDEQLAAKVRRN